MRHGLIQMARGLAFLALAGCASNNDGAAPPDLRVPPLDSRVIENCPHPADVPGWGPSVADQEVFIGNLGDALIICDRARGLAVTAYRALVDALVAVDERSAGPLCPVWAAR